MDYQAVLFVILFALLGAAWLWVKWGESGDDKREFAEMLVKFAYQRLTDKPGQERFAYVMGKLRERYPKAPVDLLEHLIEATVYDVKQGRHWIALDATVEETSDEATATPGSSVRWN